MTEQAQRSRTWLSTATGTGVLGLGVSLVALLAAGAVGLAAGQPWLFPSLGPTVMLMAQSPDDPSARWRNALVGHVVGILVGVACLHAFGVAGRAPAPVGGLTSGYVLAGAVSVGVTALLLSLLRHPHPPAGASTLIVSLGILQTPRELAVMVGAVVLVVALTEVLVGLVLRTRQPGPD
jgi:CBS-domain-containing membrane protein